VPPPPIRRSQLICTARDGRDALGPTWPAGQNSHKRQAGAAPFKESSLAGAALAHVVVDHCERRDRERSASAKARGDGGWRAGVAAGALSRPQARGGSSRSSLHRKTPRCRARFHSCRARTTWRPPLSVAGAHGRGRVRAVLSVQPSLHGT
jgi:hypothetical protein